MLSKAYIVLGKAHVACALPWQTCYAHASHYVPGATAVGARGGSSRPTARSAACNARSHGSPTATTASDAGWKRPPGHCLHVACAVWSWCWPFLQSSQSQRPWSPWAWPLEHASHLTVLPAAALKRPGAHMRHNDWSQHEPSADPRRRHDDVGNGTRRVLEPEESERRSEKVSEWKRECERVRTKE